MTLKGIDISSAQYNLDLYKVKFDFCIVKGTGGVSYVNPRCDHHMQQIFKLKRLAGVYHFAHEYGKMVDANKEADWFIKNCKNYFPKAMVILDYEVPLNGSSFNSKDVKWVHKFVARMKAKAGVTPVLYVSKSLVNSLNWSSVVNQNVGLWYAQYPNNNRTGYQKNPWTDKKGFGTFNKSVIMHQYSSNGKLSGWAYPLDLNIFYGNKTQFKAYYKKSK